MNKRLRKKRRLGEFTQLGFCVDAEWNIDVKNFVELYDKICDDFIDLVENNSLSCCGGSNPHTFGMIVTGDCGVLIKRKCKDGQWKRVGRGKKRSATKEDQSLVREWFEKRSEFKNVKITELYDVNHASRCDACGKIILMGQRNFKDKNSGWVFCSQECLEKYQKGEVKNLP